MILPTIACVGVVAYVSLELARIGEVEIAASTTVVTLATLVPASTVAVASYAAILPSGPTADVYAQRDVFALGVLFAFFAAFDASAFVAFATAFAVVPFAVVWIQLATKRGLVRYDPSTSAFLVSRAALYATARGVTRALEVRAGLDVRLGRLIPFFLATAETIAMWVLGASASYTFRIASADGFAYATFKAALFLVLPIVEDLARRGA